MNRARLKINFIGPILDPSGYASAVRKSIIALHELGHDIAASHHDFDRYQRPLLGKEGEIIMPLLNRKRGRPDAYIIKMTPDVMQTCYSHLYRTGVPVIGWFYWETTLIPGEWVPCLNACDAVIVPSEYQKRVCRTCGVTVPISVIGACVDVEAFAQIKHNDNKDKFTFYSVFQWTERKNPVDLLRIYWHTFFNVRDVKLVIKTYLSNHGESDVEKLHQKYIQIAADFPLARDVFSLKEGYPEVELVTHMLSESEMMNLHANGDVFVLLHRGEGFGLPIVEAMAAGNPAITTNYYACEDYLTKYNSYPVDYFLEPVHSMPWIHWYRGIQMWGRPDVAQAGRYMMQAYRNRDDVRERGQIAQKTIQDKYNQHKIAQEITDTIYAAIAARGKR